MNKYLVSLLFLMTSFTVLFAQDYIFNIKTNKKIIKVSELGMSDNMTVQDALEVMPELLGKDIEMVFDNYDVQIDDKSIASGSESAILQLRLGDVKEIEISKSPSASSQKKGQGGVVNIILKHAEEGFNGMVILDASTQWDVMPNVQLSYKKNKVEMFGWMMAEFYHPNYNNEYSVVTDNNLTRFVADTINNNYGTQNARFYMRYKPTDNDVLKFWVTETFEKEKTVTDETTYSFGIPSDPIHKTDMSDNLSLAVSAEYNHFFARKSEFAAEMDYNYNPKNTSSDVGSVSHNNRNRPNIFTSKVKYKHIFESRGAGRETSLEGGANFKIQNDVDLYDDLNSYSNMTYLSPYVEYKGKYGKWQFSTSLRYQFNRFAVQQSSEDGANKNMHDFTGNIVAMWQFRPHQNLRFNVERVIAKPSYYQVYPFMVFRPQQNCRVLGNPYLSSVPTWAAGVNYIFDHLFTTGTLVFDAGFDFRHSSGVIREQTLLQKSEEIINPVITYENGGKLNNICFDFMLFYKYTYFSVALSANAFSNFENWNDSRSQYGYFNISFSPTLEFQKHWTLSGRLTYYSKIETLNSTLGDQFSGRLRLTKIWKNIDAHIEIADIFKGMTKDIIFDDNQVMEQYYDFKKTYFQLGVTVKF